MAFSQKKGCLPMLLLHIPNVHYLRLLYFWRNCTFDHLITLGITHLIYPRGTGTRIAQDWFINHRSSSESRSHMQVIRFEELCYLQIETDNFQTTYHPIREFGTYDPQTLICQKTVPCSECRVSKSWITTTETQCVVFKDYSSRIAFGEILTKAIQTNW